MSIVDTKETAARLGATLRIAARLARDKRGDPQDWNLMRLGSPVPGKLRDFGASVEDQQRLFANRLNGWLAASHIRPALAWPGSGAFQLTVGGLLDALLLQLAFNVGRVGSLHMCQRCWKAPASRKANLDGQRLCTLCATARRVERLRQRRSESAERHVTTDVAEGGNDG